MRLASSLASLNGQSHIRLSEIRCGRLDNAAEDPPKPAISSTICALPRITGFQCCRLTRKLVQSTGADRPAQMRLSDLARKTISARPLVASHGYAKQPSPPYWKDSN